MKAGRFSTFLFFFFISFSAVAQSLDVQLLTLTNATASEEQKIKSALRLIKKVVNSSEFREAVLSMRYRVWGRSYRGFAQTSDSAETVLKKILQAEENFSGGSASSIDLNLDMYYEESDTVGYTNPDDPFMHMNRYIHDSYSAAQTAGNIFHEWLHKINYGHSFYGMPQRPHSVPYKLGDLLATMAAKIESEGDLIRFAMLKQRIDQHKIHCQQGEM